MQVVLLRVVVSAGVRGVGVVAVGGAGLALDVEQRRVGEEGGRAGQPQRVLRMRAAAASLRVRVRVRMLCVRVRRMRERRRLRASVRLALRLRYALTRHRLRQ